MVRNFHLWHYDYFSQGKLLINNYSLHQSRCDFEHWSVTTNNSSYKSIACRTILRHNEEWSKVCLLFTNSDGGASGIMNTPSGAMNTIDLTVSCQWCAGRRSMLVSRSQRTVRRLTSRRGVKTICVRVALCQKQSVLYLSTVSTGLDTIQTRTNSPMRWHQRNINVRWHLCMAHCYEEKSMVFQRSTIDTASCPHWTSISMHCLASLSLYCNIICMYI